MSSRRNLASERLLALVVEADVLLTGARFRRLVAVILQSDT
jgi:hypothetical protein